MYIYTYIYIYIIQQFVNKCRGFLINVVKLCLASALEKPGTWVRLPASVRFLFVPLRPLFCAALAKRWKVQFRQG